MMVIRKSISIRLLLGVLTLFGALTSCSQMDEIGRPADDAASTTEGNFYIQLSLEDSYGSQGSTRAVRANTLPEGYDSETPGTPTENAIRNLYLFFYDAETGKYITTVNVNPSQLIKDDYRYKMNLPEGIGTKMLIYCVANLANGADGNADPTVFQHDKAYETATMASVKTEYLDVINDFVPGSYGRVSRYGRCAFGHPDVGASDAG
ncbi:MAG: hypothetical protein LUC45_05315 [Paraprevotella sp.]|nr:hypothetical protein [Paraprevotella sp.]